MTSTRENNGGPGMIEQLSMGYKEHLTVCSHFVHGIEGKEWIGGKKRVGGKWYRVSQSYIAI